MAHYEVVCADCGDLYEARRRTATVCAACRVIRNMTYAAKKFRRVRRCRACGQQFRPLHARDYDHCGTCAQGYAKTDAAVCGMCGQTRACLPGTTVCVECAKDPEKQPDVLRRLRISQAKRKTVDARARLAAVAAGTYPRIRDKT